MNPIVYRITLDLSENGVQHVVSGIKAGDTNRKIEIRLTNNGTPYEIEPGTVAQIRAKVGDVNHVELCEVDGNVISYTVNTNMISIEGETIADVELGKYDEEGAFQSFATAEIMFLVYEPVVDTGTVPEAYQGSILEAVAQATGAATRANDAAKDANEAAGSANLSAAYADVSKARADEAAENAKNSAEDANEAAGNANNAAKDANEAANDAREGGDYARLQGLYAESAWKALFQGPVGVSNALKGSASGNPVVLSDVSPLEHEIGVKVNVAGAAVQISGKNLLDFATIARNVGWSNSDGYWGGGISQIYNTYKKQTGNSMFNQFLPNTQYTFRCLGHSEKDTEEAGIAFLFTYLDGSADTLCKLEADNKTDQYVTITSEAGKTVSGIYVSWSGNAQYAYLKDIQLKIGAEDTIFEPFSGIETITADENGIVSGVRSHYPTTVLSAGEGVEIVAEYNRDVNEEKERLYAEIDRLNVRIEGMKRVFSPLYGKKVVFTGDSICAGISDETGVRGWAQRIGEKYAMDWSNKGVSGGTITNRIMLPSSPFCIADTDFGESPDYIILEGGTNDADLIGCQKDANGNYLKGDDGYLIPNESHGTVSKVNYGSTPFNTDTFCGAVEYLFERVTSDYAGAKIGFIIAPKMGGWADGRKYNYTAENSVRRRYFETVIALCKKWGIPYIDLWNGCYLNPMVEGHNWGDNPFYKNNDMQHLTARGYDYITPMIAGWMETL